MTKSLLALLTIAIFLPAFCYTASNISEKDFGKCSMFHENLSLFQVDTPVILTCAVDVIETSCQTQDSINYKFEEWLSTTTFTGGCDASISNNNSGAPSACGGSTIVVFTVTSSCDTVVTCSATFEVSSGPGPSLVLNCPVNIIETACQSQDSINAKFADWLATATFTGGCNASISNNNSGAPSACGGVSTVIFTVTDCDSLYTCSATFEVTNGPLIILTCPTNVTETACQSQDSINAKFTDWLATATFTGGCNASISNNNSGAPSACGGVSTVIFTVTDCDSLYTCSATFEVTNGPLIILTCPINVTETACQSQDSINAKFADWLATSGFSGGCDATMSNNNTGAPPACGGVATVLFTVTNCDSAYSCSTKFEVNPSAAVVLTCPGNVTEAACQSQASIDSLFADWLATAGFSGGCDAAISNNSMASPSACGGSVTVTFAVTSNCEPTKTCSAKFTVTNSPVVILTCPDNHTEDLGQTQAEIDSIFNDWLASANFSGGCHAVISNDNTGAPPNTGGSASVRFTVTSSCEGPKTCSSEFDVKEIIATKNTNIVKRFELTPNPVSGNGLINVQLDHSRNFKLKMVNVYGEIVWSMTFNNTHENVPIDLTSYSKGMYFIVLNSGNTQKAMKWVLN